MTCTNTTDAFEAQRPRLAGLAYRMLGSVAEAEDVVQDAWLRWHGTDRDTVRDAGAFLRHVVARLCLDRLESARARRETYVGTWLPEPVVDEATVSGSDAGEWAEDLSFALMLALERRALESKGHLRRANDVGRRAQWPEAIAAMTLAKAVNSCA